MKKILLCILDGMGIRESNYGNAFLNAKKDNFDYLWNNYPHSLLEASGKYVGLPLGQMGNSEVGHINIGSGRIVYQPLEFINKSIEDKSFYDNKNLIETINHTKNNNSKLHIMGLLSDGGVHSHINHLFELFEVCKKNNFTNVYFHFFLDGRDTNIGTGIKYLDMVNLKIKEYGFGTISTISGRYYAMDRDNRYDRVKKAYDNITLGNGLKYNDYYSYFNDFMNKNITDEFMEPGVINKDGLINDNDGIIVFNYRPDRLRELFGAISNKDFKCFDRKILKNLKVVTMMPVSNEVISKPCYQYPILSNTLGEYLDNLGISQLRIAETEKYAHVTYFFDGGEEKKLKHSKRILINSSHVATYDLKPEMSAYEITNSLVEEVNKNNEDFIVLNYANGDMVGHTGNYDASLKAVEVVDICLGKLYDNLKDKYTFVITADHGNCELMINEDNSINTAHTTSKVPFIIVGDNKNISLKNGKLGDIAPTILELMDINIPKEMTGESLIINK